ncbi:unnamed protein product [Effrenium voratum]|uniref:Uncharacterized protein n=1 Tax=Effrenium voratum TaxID=2562239 RepID=A0AA36MSL8_9DINO|nr:unnamed protein product [Effrenium voratum]CAJ1412907.1 unnamed protein product [Effrenium voratum]
MFALMLARPVRSAQFRQMEEFPGAVSRAAAVRKKWRSSWIAGLLPSLGATVLLGVFLLHDPAQSNELELRAVGVVLYGLSSILPTAISVFHSFTLYGAMDLTLAATCGVADSVVEGMALPELAKATLGLKGLYDDLSLTAIASLLQVTAMLSSFTAHLAVVLAKWPAPPAFFVLQALLVFVGALTMPVPAAQISAELDRIVVALAMRSLKADSMLVHPSGDIGEGAGMHATDLFLLRLGKARLGFFIGGLPATTAFFSGLKLVFLPILLAVVRRHVDLGL